MRILYVNTVFYLGFKLAFHIQLEIEPEQVQLDRSEHFTLLSELSESYSNAKQSFSQSTRKKTIHIYEDNLIKLCDQMCE